MTKALRMMSESWVFKLYTAAIGTLILVVITISSFTLDRAFAKLDQTAELTNKNTNIAIAMCKDIASNKEKIIENRRRINILGDEFND